MLQQHGVDGILDVRSAPWSRFCPQFRKNALAAALAEAGLGYVLLGDALGGRPKALAHITDAAERYAAIAAGDSFARGLEQVRTHAGRHRVALMCAERDPIDCHRALLVARHLAAAGAEIYHIHADGDIESHPEFERRLLTAAGPSPAPLFAEEKISLAAAYDAAARGTIKSL